MPSPSGDRRSETWRASPSGTRHVRPQTTPRQADKSEQGAADDDGLDGGPALYAPAYPLRAYHGIGAGDRVLGVLLRERRGRTLGAAQLGRVTVVRRRSKLPGFRNARRRG